MPRLETMVSSLVMKAFGDQPTTADSAENNALQENAKVIFHGQLNCISIR